MNSCKKIAVIFPMAGEGTRFADHGNTIKPLIDIDNKLMFQHAVDSALSHLAGFVVQLVFIIRKEQQDTHNLATIIQQKYPTAKVTLLEQRTKGALETVYNGIKDIADDTILWSIDCDLAFHSQKLKENLSTSSGGALLVFNSNKDRYSYVQTNKQGEAIKVREKEVISNMAIAGAYLFPSTSLFRTHAREIIDSNETSKQEFYISQVIDRLITQGVSYSVYQLDSYRSFGTPEELNHPSINDQ